MTKYFLVNGSPQSGKDSFIQFIQKETGKHILNYSTIDTIRYFLNTQFSITKENKEGRKLLSDIKKDLVEYDKDIFIKELKNLPHEQYDIVFIHCREPEEIIRFKQSFSDLKVIYIRRKNNHVPSNRSDIIDYSKDFIDEIIENDSTIEALFEKTKDFIERYNLS